jgi:L-seryl-tRNA(Ser) seleniumtransferase
MPTAALASFAVVIGGRSANALDRTLRAASVPVIARIEDGQLWLDVRTISDEDAPDVVAAVRGLAVSLTP